MGVSASGQVTSDRLIPPEPIGRLGALLDTLRDQKQFMDQEREAAYENLQAIDRRLSATELRIRVLEDAIYCFSVEQPKRKLVGDMDG